MKIDTTVTNYVLLIEKEKKNHNNADNELPVPCDFATTGSFFPFWERARKELAFIFFSFLLAS